jgi:hypothetical protein
MLKNKIFLYFSIFILILLIALGFYYFLFKNKKVEDKNIPNEISIEEKTSLIKELNESIKDNPISDKERIRIVNDLNVESAKEKELTDEEKINLLKRLNQ